jgi:adenine phosphoribosyltransferase
MDITAELERAIRTISDFPKPGIQFKDITPLLARPALVHDAVDALAEPFLNDGITKVIGIEARGFILGAMLAHRLEAGFVPVRKPGKLPYDTYGAEYELEYGTDRIEMHVDAMGPHDRVLIHDDVIATGGTSAAAFELVQQTEAEVVGYAFLLELSFLRGRAKLEAGLAVHSVLVV